jgi:hypothetical protein
VSLSPLRVFYGYSPKDETARAELDESLAPLRAANLIAIVPDPGAAVHPSQASEAARRALDEANIILLLISRSFLDSEVCYGQMTRALARRSTGHVVVLPILLEPVDLNFRRPPFTGLMPLPSSGEPVSRWKSRAEAFVDIARDIRRVVKLMRAR